MDALLQRLPCRSCARRAQITSPSVRAAEDMDAIDESMDDPDMYIDHPAVSSATPSSKAPEKEKEMAAKTQEKPKFAADSKLAEKDGEVAMLKGNTFMLREEYEEALAAYEHAIKLQPSLEDAHIGKINALRKLHKYMRAFSSCREALVHVKSKEIQGLRETIQKEYQANKAREAAKKEKAVKKASKFVDQKLRDEMEAGCPGSAGTLKAAAKASIQDATDEERDAWKQEMLNIYRDLFNRPGSQPVSTAEAVKESTSSYSSDLKLGLQIADGHRAMPRPQDVQLPSDYRKSVGAISLQKLQQYGCANDRLLVSVYGDIFDVSDRPDKYGKDGPYHYFSGADISWGLASGQDDEKNVNKFFDVWKLPTPEDRDRKLQILCSWLGFYEKEYGEPVGRLEVFDNERNLPAPMASEDCCVM